MYYILLYLEKKDEELLYQHIENIVDKGVNNHLIKTFFDPHITLSLLKQTDEEKLINNFNKLKYYSFDIKLTNVGIFNGKKKVMFLAPSYNEDLFNLHKSLYKEIDDESNTYFDSSVPSNWTPHITIATKMPYNEFENALRYLNNLRLPITVKAKSVGLYKDGKGKIETLSIIDF